LSSTNGGDLRLVTYADLADAWGVSIRTVQRWIAADQAQGYRVRYSVRRVNAARRYVVIRVVDAEAVFIRHSPVKQNLH
jgi:predicted DNA-binding transcriptional regulator YafY